ncbi:MAG: 30S ribosomal protein S6 [Candidatus Berkelbacteria bacterium]
MREYELTYLVSDDVAEADLKKITDKVNGFIVSDGGKVTKEESWGRRKLAYPILKLNFATYITVWFETEATKLAQLDHELRVFPQVIRHLTTLKVEKSEVLKVTREDVVGSSAVEEVLGERSFEVVEGETEGSKDLMSVRGKEDSTTLTETQIDTDKTEEEISKIEPEPEKEVEVVEKPVAEKKATKPKKADKPVESKENEADRMKKLDDKLDELLSDDL